MNAAQPGQEWARVEVVESAGSTNELVAVRARAGEPEGLVVVAEHQTAGRGRLERVWVTPPGTALTFSVLLRPDAVRAERWPWLPLLVGVAVAGALREEGVDARLKWPNDVLVGDRKLAGILLERVETPTGPAAVVGIGINVSQTRDELPVPQATSLYAEGRTSDRGSLLAVVLANLGVGYASWSAAGGDPDRGLRVSYEGLCATLGSTVRVEVPTGPPVLGRAVGIDPAGRLIVGTGGGEVAIGAGDVVHVRPAVP
ncbi:MAG: biotin--[acetyl-CoA-carboxylase] ligase [Nocardioidaceae bacterium]